MNVFPCHDIDTAPQGARAILAQAEKSYGMVPNLFRKMAEAPVLVEGYWQMARLFERSSLTPIEQQVVLIAASVVNRCTYCVGIHSAMAEMMKIPIAVTGALRNAEVIPDERLEMLRRFTQSVVEHRGWVPREQVQAFLDAGFTGSQVLEVILGVGLKTLSNYTNHLVDTELDDPFKSHAWTPAP